MSSSKQPVVCHCLVAYCRSTMKFKVLYSVVLSFTTTFTLVSTLICHDCPLRHYNFFITPNNIPDFTYCTLNETKQNFCSLNFFSDDNGNTSKLRANPNHGVEHANVSYITAGFDVPRSFDVAIGLGLLYQCMTDYCNNPQTVLKRILEATTIETYKPPQSLSVIVPASSADPLTCFTYNNFTSLDECRPLFHRRLHSSNGDEICSTYCVTTIKIDSADLKTEQLCSYCEQETKERFSYIDERVFLLDQRINRLQQLEYICNSSKDCNSLENIRQIQQRYKIDFDFDRFHGNNGSEMAVISRHLQYIAYLLAIFVLLRNN